MEEIAKNLDELEANLSKTKKYYDYDDAEYRGIKDVKDLFDLSIDEDYYKSIITNSAFNLKRENQVILLMITMVKNGIVLL